MLDIAAGNNSTRGGELLPVVAIHIHAVAVLVPVGIVEDGPGAGAVTHDGVLADDIAQGELQG